MSVKIELTRVHCRAPVTGVTLAWWVRKGMNFAPPTRSVGALNWGGWLAYGVKSKRSNQRTSWRANRTKEPKCIVTLPLYGSLNRRLHYLSLIAPLWCRPRRFLGQRPIIPSCLSCETSTSLELGRSRLPKPAFLIWSTSFGRRASVKLTQSKKSLTAHVSSRNSLPSSSLV